MRVAAQRSNELVAAAGLRDRDSALIEPRLQIRVRPRLVDPVTRVVDSLAGFVCHRLVV